MLFSFVVLNSAGRPVLEKRWRHTIPRRALDELWKTLEGAGLAAPALQLPDLLPVHVARGKVVLVGVLRRDAPVLLAVQLLHRMGDLLELYLKELSEESLRANFVTVYQLLDEIIENGTPLHTEPNVLQQLVMQPGKMDSIVASMMGTSQVRDALPESMGGSSPWRRSGVRYATNELYLDLHERLDVLVDGRNGLIQCAEVRRSADAPRRPRRSPRAPCGAGLRRGHVQLHALAHAAPHAFVHCAAHHRGRGAARLRA